MYRKYLSMHNKAKEYADIIITSNTKHKCSRSIQNNKNRSPKRENNILTYHLQLVSAYIVISRGKRAQLITFMYFIVRLTIRYQPRVT